MSPVATRELIESFRPADVSGVELRRGFGVARPVPRHWHEEYQLCLIQAGSGELHYRRDTLATPPASLFIVHPGEVHSNRAHEDAGCTYRTMFIPPAMMRDATGDSKSLPFASQTVTFDHDIIQSYLRVHFAFENSSSSLARESALTQFLSLVNQRCCEVRLRAISAPAREALIRARDYLAAHFDANVSLRELACIAGLSAFHFNRAFAEQFGMPPHAFQCQLRVHRAKHLLRDGCSIAQTALACGFVDQSHLNRQFKRLTGISPGRFLNRRFLNRQFLNRKIVQDGAKNLS